MLTSVRRPMNNQTSCATTHASDLETKYTRDTWGRLTKLEKPRGNCIHYEYDLEGRLEVTKLTDDCVPAKLAGPLGANLQRRWFVDEDRAIPLQLKQEVPPGVHASRRPSNWWDRQSRQPDRLEDTHLS